MGKKMIDRKQLIKKGYQMLSNFMAIDYYVTKSHLVGFLEAQTGITSKQSLIEIRPILENVAAEILQQSEQRNPIQIQLGLF